MTARQPHTSLRARESPEICLTSMASRSPHKRKGGAAKARRSDPQAFKRFCFIAASTCTATGQINCSPLQNRQSVKSRFKKGRQKSILALEGLNIKKNKKQPKNISSVISSAQPRKIASGTEEEKKNKTSFVEDQCSGIMFEVPSSVCGGNSGERVQSLTIIVVRKQTTINGSCKKRPPCRR